jgi:hypothetical protein
LGWKILIDAFEVARSQIPPSQWLQVRYEDVVAEPRKHIADIVDFSGLTWTDDFERAFAQYPFEASRIDGFRRDLDPASVALLEHSLAATLHSLGYATPAIEAIPAPG